MALSREEMFEAWAPADSPWSAWAKPVLFAHAPEDGRGAVVVEELSAGALGYAREAAVVVDLPGRQSALMGLALAQAGYQPVPLYNSAPGPGALVDMELIARLLPDIAEKLKSRPPKPDAPPAFLLNSDRIQNGPGVLAPARYDNRWRVVPQDMPSAEFLIAAEIKRVIVVGSIYDDLAHVLYRYQEARLQISRIAKEGDAPVAIEVSRPKSYKSLWYRLGVFAGLRRNSAGGFGAMTPDPAATGASGFS